MLLMPGVFEMQDATTREKIMRVGTERTAMPINFIMLGGIGIVGGWTCISLSRKDG